MARTVSIAQAKNELPALVHETERHPIDIERRGKRVAVLLSSAAYDRLAKTPGDPWIALENFRAKHDLTGLDLGDVFTETRDRKPGRNVRW